MKCQYVGAQDQESGLIHGCHIWDRQPFSINTDVCEQSYFYKVAKPCEGMRVCWVPKDDMDSEMW
jgi:hypothetical protein